MAVLALAAAGAATGAAIGGTFLGVTAASWGWMAGSMLGNALFGGTKSQGPRLSDLRFTGTEYGQPIPWVAGAPRVSGQIIWASTKRELAKTESVGKGGGSEYTSYTYEIDLLILLSENVTAGVSRVWSNGELVFNGATVQSGVWSEIQIYTGEPDQLPDPTYEAAVGLGNAPAYRGRTTVLIRGLQLGNSGQLPNLTFEFGMAGFVSGDVGFLNQFDHMPTATSFESTVGPDAQRYSTYALTQATSGTQFGGSAAQGCWSSGQIPADLTKPWRWESWFNPTSTSFTNPFLRVGSQDGSLNYLNISFGEFDRWVIDYNSADMGALRRTASYTAWPSMPTGQWYHIAVQHNGYGRISVFCNGRFVGSAAGGATGLSPLDNKLIFIAGVQGQTGFKWDSTILRSSLPADDVWPDADGYAIPTDPFSLYSGYAVGWYDTTPDPLSLQKTVDALMLRAGYDQDEWDSSDLASVDRPLRAMALAQVGTTRAALETLASAYFFNSSKGDQIVFRRRSSATPMAIDWDDLATAEDATTSGEPFALNTGSDMEVPAQVALSYPNMAADYNAATEHSARLLGAQDSTQAVQLGLGMLPAEAKLVADAILFDQVTAMVTASISLPPTYSHLQAGDVLLVPDGHGRQHRMLVDKRTDTALVAALDLRQDDPTAFESSGITDTGYALTDTVRQLAPTWWQALDIPLLRDGDDAPGYYVALGPNKAAATDIWRGAVFVRAWLPEQWETAAEADDAATLGATTSALPAWNGRNVMDESTVLTVRVSGQLASATRDALQADRTLNVLLIGSEIIRFRQADLLGTTDGENDYRLTGLLRAQLGTEWAATAGSAIGVRAVLLSSALRRVTDQTSQVGVLSSIKAVSRGLLLSSASAQDFANTAICLKPLAPVHLRAVPAGGDLSITWQRRTRLGYRYGGTAGVSVPLGEESEAYRVRIYSGATLLRTLDATATYATYTAAQQAADGLSSAATITLQVVQRSAAVGDGYPATLNTTTP